MEEKIVLQADDGSELTLFVIEETKINGVNYLLAADSEEGDSEAFILKDISREDEQEAVYVAVEEDAELEAVAKIFEELLGDVEIL
ncbi:MAG: DUF1292 domain-containing protein [Lachnospiraceae bacterium]